MHVQNKNTAVGCSMSMRIDTMASIIGDDPSPEVRKCAETDAAKLKRKRSMR